MSEIRAKDPAYVAFVSRLDAETRLDMPEYAEWLHQRECALRHAFKRSGETDPVIYCRMQYVRFRRGGLV